MKIKKEKLKSKLKYKKSDEELLKSKDPKALDLNGDLNSKVSSKEKIKGKEGEIVKEESKASLADLNNDENLMRPEDQKLSEDKN